MLQPSSGLIVTATHRIFQLEPRAFQLFFDVRGGGQLAFFRFPGCCHLAGLRFELLDFFKAFFQPILGRVVLFLL